MEASDPSSGRPYYYHAGTGETSWERPGSPDGGTVEGGGRGSSEKTEEGAGEAESPPPESANSMEEATPSGGGDAPGEEAEELAAVPEPATQPSAQPVRELEGAASPRRSPSALDTPHPPEGNTPKEFQPPQSPVVEIPTNHSIRERGAAAGGFGNGSGSGEDVTRTPSSTAAVADLTSPSFSGRLTGDPAANVGVGGAYALATTPSPFATPLPISRSTDAGEVADVFSSPPPSGNLSLGSPALTQGREQGGGNPAAEAMAAVATLTLQAAGASNGDARAAAAPLEADKPVGGGNCPPGAGGTMTRESSSGSGSYARSGYSSAATLREDLVSGGRRIIRPDGFHSSSSDVVLQAKYGHQKPSASDGKINPPPRSANAGGGGVIPSSSPSSFGRGALSSGNPFSGGAAVAALNKKLNPYGTFGAGAGAGAGASAADPTNSGQFRMFDPSMAATAVSTPSPVAVTPGQEQASSPSGDAPSSPGALPPGWQEHADPSSGQPYYFNPDTGVTAWERPVVEPAVDPQAQAEPSSSGSEQQRQQQQDAQQQTGQGGGGVASTAGASSEEPRKEERAFSEHRPSGAANEVLAPGWQEHVDQGSGRPYYFNAETNVTTWEKPLAEGPLDETQGAEEASSEQGQGQTAAETEGGEGSDTPAPVELRSAEAEPRAMAVTEDVAGDSLPEGWLEATDPGSNMTYYYNAVTGVTSWERPRGLSHAPEEEVPGSEAAAETTLPVSPSPGGEPAGQGLLSSSAAATSTLPAKDEGKQEGLSPLEVPSSEPEEAVAAYPVGMDSPFGQSGVTSPTTSPADFFASPGPSSTTPTTVVPSSATKGMSVSSEATTPCAADLFGSSSVPTTAAASADAAPIVLADDAAPSSPSLGGMLPPPPLADLGGESAAPAADLDDFLPPPPMMDIPIDR